ncbi:unnamed protein product [Cuscuta campestris]|uniref:Uncharacterized protein n=1 Tax=Cuscuta campestris TaxID=132261 RepID=A0A484LXR5_9ASTE|nr:unnamed protein product [Cuscuta campestris]
MLLMWCEVTGFVLELPCRLLRGITSPVAFWLGKMPSGSPLIPQQCQPLQSKSFWTLPADILQSSKTALGESQTLTIEESPHVVFSKDNPRLARKDICDDLADSLERIHVDDYEENTGIYTNTQPQTEEIPHETNQGDDERQEEEEEQEEHEEEEATELPIAWRTNKNHPLDQVIGSINRGERRQRLPRRRATPKLRPQRPRYLDGSFLEFGSEEELTRFLTYFAKRPISPSRVLPELYPQQKGYHDLDNQLKESGLWSFVSRSRQSYNPAYIRAFYSNLRRDGDTIRSSINLYDIEIDLVTFARVAGLPTRGDDIATYGGDDWILNNEAVVIRELGITNLDLKAVHAITHGASINWAKYVMIHMADCASITNERSLPYAFLIMDLIVSTDIHIAGPDTKMTKLWIIQDSTFRKKFGDQGGAGPSRARAPARAPAPAPARASLQSITDTLNRLTLTVDGMGQSIERMDWTLQRQHHDMMAYFRGVNYVPPPFDSTILGQNFEGEDEDDNSYAPSSSPNEADFDDAVDGDAMDIEDDEEDDDAEDEDAAA